MSTDTTHILGRSTIGAGRGGSAMHAVAKGLAWLLYVVLAGQATAATITVTTTDDLPLTNIDPNTCSLREAIRAVLDTSPEDGCPAGSPDSADTPDTIDFALPLPATITLSGALPTLGELNNSIDDGVTIRGPGARFLTISGANRFRVFRIFPAQTVTIEGLTIANGRIDDGGGVLNQGILTIRNATIAGNFGTDDGGGIDNLGTLRVENSTFTGNRTNEEGGGVVNFQNATFVNTTFSGNRAGLNATSPTGRDGGGAIFNSGGTVTLINCTIAGNTNVGGTQLGDGIFTEDHNLNDADPSNDRIAHTTLQNTLIAANDDDNCMPTGQQNPIADGGGNLDDGTSCAFSQNTSLSNATAGLATGLQNNGGPTDTIALTAASDAIDLGRNDFCSGTDVKNQDQRGATRPTDGDGDGNAFCDIGAFESGAVLPPSNQPPVVTNPGNQTSVVGANVNLAIGASDPNGDTLSYSATGLPAGLSINAGTGVITGTVSTAGASNVTVTVSDGKGGTTPTSFTWTVTSASTGDFRYVKLEEVSEVSGKAFGSAAELNVLDTSGNTIGRTGWVASADSAETSSPAAKAIDGNPATLWHTRFVGASPPPPHWLVVDMGTSHPVGGFRYLPRQDGSSNGRIAGYRFYGSTDGVNWGTPVAQGAFANNSTEKTVTFGAPPSNQPPVVTNPGNQTSVVGTNVNLAIGASDPNGDTLSYSATGLPAGLSINAGTGVITGTVSTAGASNVTVTVSDGKGGTTPTSFTWTVMSASTGGFRYVKLEEVSEVSGKAFGSAAELNVLDTSGTTIGRTGWVASADSAETNSPAAKAIDGNPATLWHTRFVGASPPPPHWLVVDMGTSYPVGGFRYLPRQDGSSNGRIAGYKFYISVDGVSWGTPVAQGTFANTPAEKTVTFGAPPSK